MPMEQKKKITAEVKHMLRAVKYANDNIERLNNLLLVIRSRAEKMTTSYSDTPGGGHNPDSRADTIAKLVDTERKQQEAIRRWCQAIVEVQTIISWLDKWEERSVLEHRYINCEDWITISMKLNYSVSHLNRFHGDALLKLAKMIQKKEEKK